MPSSTGPTPYLLPGAGSCQDVGKDSYAPPPPRACSLSKNLLCWVARARREKQPCFLRGPPKKEKGRFLYGSEGGGQKSFWSFARASHNNDNMERALGVRERGSVLRIVSSPAGGLSPGFYRDQGEGRVLDYTEGNSFKKRISASLSASKNWDFPYHFLLLCSLLYLQCFYKLLEMNIHQFL